jgi:hypothetical protein
MPHVPAVTNSQANKAGREWRRLAAKVIQVPDAPGRQKAIVVGGLIVAAVVAGACWFTAPAN